MNDQQWRTFLAFFLLIALGTMMYIGFRFNELYQKRTQVLQNQQYDASIQKASHLQPNEHLMPINANTH